MSDNFLGEIRMFGGNFAIKGWALCDGQVLPISQNQALYSLFGTTYGGNGTTTFALPDLRGRLPVGQGQGPGLSNRPIGQRAGAEEVNVTLNELPLHSHPFSATAADATTSNVASNVLTGKPTVVDSRLYVVRGSVVNPQVQLAPGVVGNTGGSLGHSNLMPSLCVTFIIALVGVYPSRN